MAGGLRLLQIFLFCSAFAIAVFSEDASVKGASTSGPPLAPQKPVEDVVQGHKITDPYRWLETSDSPDTKQWVSDELAYTRSRLDPLPGRDQLHKRLAELLSIGTISEPQLGGKYYFYTSQFYWCAKVCKEKIAR
jgi:prolyl oligopeptidase